MKFDVKENRTSRNQNFAENKSLSDQAKASDEI
jgi:hypothetical protein